MGHQGGDHKTGYGRHLMIQQFCECVDILKRDLSQHKTKSNQEVPLNKLNTQNTTVRIISSTRAFKMHVNVV